MAQSPQFAWAKQFGHWGFDWGHAIATDRLGNIVVTGSFEDTISFGDITLVSAGGNDIFIAKFDRSGEALWAVRAGGTKNFDEGFGITTDPFNNIIVTGRFNGSVTFGLFSLDSGEKVGFFLAKYDPDGQALWAVQGAGEGYGVAASQNGVIYLAGGLPPGGVFVYRYDSNGNLIWRQYGQSTGTAYATGITLDPSGSILVTGRFTGNLGFEKMGLVGSPDYNMFLLKYHESGELLWAQKADYANGTGVGRDGQYNIYVTGWFYGETQLGNIALASKRPNMFIAKYDFNGNVVWAKPMKAMDGAFGRGIATDIDGNSFVAGEFLGTLTFDNIKFYGPGMFIAKYDSAGNVLWAQKVRGTSNVKGLGVAVDSTGNPAVTGSFYQNADFGFANMKTAGGTDGFVAYIAKDGCIHLPSSHAFGRIIGGDRSHVEEVCYTFAGQTGDLNLLYQVYDVDMLAEVKVFLNGVHIRNEQATEDSSWSDTRALLLEDRLVYDSEPNEIRFVNAENVEHGVKRYWGVRAVSATRCIPLPFAGEVGYLMHKRGASHVNEACFSFAGQPGDFRLTYQVYDIDNVRELDILINGTKIHDEAITRNSAWSEERSLNIPDNLVNDSGLNVITFDNTQNPGADWIWLWGVRNLKISPLADFADKPSTTHAATDAELPVAYRLLPNAPNPFNPSTTIQFELPVGGEVRLSIYNLRGELVSVLVDGELPAGRHRVGFEATPLATGVYFCRLETRNFVATNKMLFAK